ncbi:MAG: hypothetical protein ACXAB4_01345, partial [Candidatus Hodarchaeales archaeon]
MTLDRQKFSRAKKPFFIAMSVCIPLILFLIVVEIILRIAPIPGTGFDSKKYDPIVGQIRYPNSITTYRNDRGDFVKRRANSLGYLDVEHSKEKEKGIYRIGFFGDSNVEARQVLLENTFFRLINKALSPRGVECLSFGNSGFSTVQSYLESKRWGPYFDLDLIVYVFCENDLGDQIKEINRSSNFPYPFLRGDMLEIDYSFRERSWFKRSAMYRIVDFVCARSLLAV